MNRLDPSNFIFQEPGETTRRKEKTPARTANADAGECSNHLAHCGHFDDKLQPETNEDDPSFRFTKQCSPALAITHRSLAEGAGRATMVRGFNRFPTEPHPDEILVGDALIRVFDTIFFNSGAGMGKSVAISQISIAWGLGLSYFGLQAARPLKILHFCGEDDETTLGQCREGFIEHSHEITGRALMASDLDTLDQMVRTEFSREFAGGVFLTRLEEMLREEPADLVMINPLLSFIGGPVVETVGPFLREGLGPILQRNRCAALVAHHTCKLNAKSWEEMDFTYSGIGGGDVANIPRSILTLAPTSVNGCFQLVVSKRKTTGWQDENGNFVDRIIIRRTDNPVRPAWLPVPYAEFEDASVTATSGRASGSRKKVPHDTVFEVLATGAMQNQALIEDLQHRCSCSEKVARNAINNARLSGKLESYQEKPPGGGRGLLWHRLLSIPKEAVE